MEMVAHLEKTSISRAMSMSNTFDSATSFFEPPISGTGNPSPFPYTLENWLQLYHSNNLAPTGQSNEHMPNENKGIGADGISNSVAHPAFLNSEATNALTITSSHLCVNGTAAKVCKKRTRASRRAPTTLLNTDTSNFKAMVQQFTGIPQAPFVSMPSQGRFPARSFPSAAAHLSYNNAQRSQQYSSFLYHDHTNSIPFFFPRAPPSQEGQPTLLDDLDLNPAAASAISTPIMLSLQERRAT